MKTKHIAGIFTIVLSLLLVGCAEQSMSDLRSFVKNATKGKSPKVEPLPKIKPHKTFTYTSSSLTNPFGRDNLVRKKPPANTGAAPDLQRRKEPLEQYPLDSLRMVGTLDRNEQFWAVLRAPDGTVHRAQKGNYIGQNFGLITTISESEVRVKEKIQGPSNGWIERDASIAIQ